MVCDFFLVQVLWTQIEESEINYYLLFLFI